MNRASCRGFTLIEVAVALGILGALTLVVATIMIRTMDTYGQVMSETDTTKQARQCMEEISREMREAVNGDVWLPADGGLPSNNIRDALLLTSARQSGLPALPAPQTTFIADANGFPVPRSIILFYINTTAEGIPQLIRHQLFYDEDLVPPYTPPFRFPPINPYQGGAIVILDNNNVPIAIDRSTGAVMGNPPLRAPKVLMNWTTSFDIFANLINPPEIRITCQSADRYGRTATTRLITQVDPRNL
jgi:prepilin-type N-terminal cleavage/methylation domain-containing protein